jgi:hypothetical protein
MQIGLTVLSELKDQLMRTTDDCEIMQTISSYLSSIDNPDDHITHNVGSTYLKFVLIQGYRYKIFVLICVCIFISLLVEGV